MDCYNGLHSIPRQEQRRQPGAVAQMLHEAYERQDVVLQASPCPRGFAQQPTPYRIQYLSDRDTASPRLILTKREMTAC